MFGFFKKKAEPENEQFVAMCDQLLAEWQALSEAGKREISERFTAIARNAGASIEEATEAFKSLNTPQRKAPDTWLEANQRLWGY